MTNITHDNLSIENLLQNNKDVRRGKNTGKKPAIKRIYRQADPHIEPRKVSGKTYYYYRRGTDKPVYLGSADFILAALVRFKEVQNSIR